MTFPSTPLQQEKQELREILRAKRLANYDKIPNASKELADIFMSKVQLEGPQIIASYNPFRAEIDPTPLMTALSALGHKMALPIVTAKGMPLTFRLYEPGDYLTDNKIGIAEPDPGAPPVDPDVLLVPLLAFDINRNRLGYGAGFYDKTLTDLRARKHIFAIGLAYSFQEVAQVPTGPQDAVLDKIATEINIF